MTVRFACTILSFAILFSSCAHSIKATGYNRERPLPVDCQVEIVKFANLQDLKATYKGGISLDDTGFSTKCKEPEAMRILEMEACKAGANFVNIYAENMPNLASTCYRCKASFYLVSDSTLLDELKTTPELLINPPKNNTGSQILGLLGGSVAGFLIGYFLIGPLLFK
jgi:hypothetical protein